MTNAGRTFAVTPKSTCQTSPRSGTSVALLLIERPERFRSQSCKVFIGQVIGHRDALHDGSSNLSTLRIRKPLDLAENMGNRLRHGFKIANRPNRSSAGKRLTKSGHVLQTLVDGPCA